MYVMTDDEDFRIIFATLYIFREYLELTFYDEKLCVFMHV